MCDPDIHLSKMLMPNFEEVKIQDKYGGEEYRTGAKLRIFLDHFAKVKVQGWRGYLKTWIKFVILFD